MYADCSTSVLIILATCVLLQADLHYHTSAILSAAVDSLSVPYRKINGPSVLADLTNALSPLGRKVCVSGFYYLFLLLLSDVVAYYNGCYTFFVKSKIELNE